MEFLQPLIDQLTIMWVGFVQTLPNLALAVVMLLATWVISKGVQKFVKAALDKSDIRPSLKAFIQTFIDVIVWLAGLLISLAIVFPSLTPAKILTALGLGSVAIGFAFKDIFENFLAGALIMLRKPMRIDDFIECSEVEGSVEKITIRDTYVRRTNGELILVPNSYLFKNPVFILTDKEARRFEIVCGVAYGEDADRARKVIADAVMRVALVDKNKEIDVLACEFNSSSIDYTVRWWAASTPRGMHESRDEVIRSVKRALDDAGIEIPFPHRTLTFKESLNLKNEQNN